MHSGPGGQSGEAGSRGTSESFKSPSLFPPPKSFSLSQVFGWTLQLATDEGARD